MDVTLSNSGDLYKTNVANVLWGTTLKLWKMEYLERIYLFEMVIFDRYVKLLEAGGFECYKVVPQFLNAKWVRL